AYVLLAAASGLSLAAENAHQLLDDLFLLGRVLRVHGPVNAMTEVLAQEAGFDPRQRSACRRDLRHDVAAVAVSVRHLANAPDLTFHPVEILENFFSHALFHIYPSRVLAHVPPQGI